MPSFSPDPIGLVRNLVSHNKRYKHVSFFQCAKYKQYRTRDIDNWLYTTSGAGAKESLLVHAHTRKSHAMCLSRSISPTHKKIMWREKQEFILSSKWPFYVSTSQLWWFICPLLLKKSIRWRKKQSFLKNYGSFGENFHLFSFMNSSVWNFPRFEVRDSWIMSKSIRTPLLHCNFSFNSCWKAT